MSNTNPPPPMDARAAAFSQPKKRTTVTYGGYEYVVRLPSMDFVDKQRESKDTPQRKGVRLIIQCTYWPENQPPTEKGKCLAGTRMFEETDLPTILAEDNDPESLWTTLLKAITDLMTRTSTVEEAKGNSEASPGTATS